MRFILASASPRRKELLEQIGVKFDILPATGEEVITKELPGEVVMELAKQKAEEVAKTAGADALVLGADTVVAYEGKILGKPKDEADALRMLTMLSGKEHEVYTGVALIDNRDQSMENFFERTKVTMYPVSEIILPVANRWIKRVPMPFKGSEQNSFRRSRGTTTML